MDLWSDRDMKSKMAMTAHYLLRLMTPNGEKLVLRTSLVGFHYVKGSHNAEKLAKNMLYLMNRAGITQKVRGNHV